MTATVPQADTRFSDGRRIVLDENERLLNAVAGAAFGKVYVKMADAFEARAKALSDQPVQQA